MQGKIYRKKNKFINNNFNANKITQIVSQIEITKQKWKNY